MYKYTGLEVFQFGRYLDLLYETYSDGSIPPWQFGPLLYSGYSSNVPLPRRTIATHFYMSYASYLSIPKPEAYRTFFVLRDPRDIIVSWYFSVRYSHSLMGPILKYRNDLEMLNFAEGMKYAINVLEQRGLFRGQRSWMNIENRDNIQIFRYENFASDNSSFLKQLFEYLNIVIPHKDFIALCDRHKFEKYSGGRKQGVEDHTAHHRKGVAGGWKDHFDPLTVAHFREVTKDLLEVLGYPE